jgi:hypothetical protein
MPLPNTGMSFTPFDPLPSSDMNNMVDNIESLADLSAFADGAISHRLLSNPYNFSATLANSIGVGASTTGIVTFDVEQYDTGANFDIVTNKGRFTAPITAFYDFFWCVEATTSGGAYYVSHLAKNGTVFRTGTGGIQGAGTGNSSYAGAARLKLLATDYVEVAWTNSSGATKNVNNSAGTYFMGGLSTKS